MGEAFDVSRYQVTVDVAALLPDLALLPKGDATEIGDRGINLSGVFGTQTCRTAAHLCSPALCVVDATSAHPLSTQQSHIHTHRCTPPPPPQVDKSSVCL
jgi:hypothetical protein